MFQVFLIKYKYFNCDQGSRIMTIFTYIYTIRNNISLKYHIVNVCYKSLHMHMIVLETDPWLCKINIGIIFVENPPGIYELPFLFCFRS